MKCFICSNAIDDNTHIILPVDGNNIDIYLCEEHSETSLKKLKELYLRKKSDLEDLIKKAKELGLKLDIKSEDNHKEISEPKIIQAQAEVPKELTKETPKIISQKSEQTEDDLISTEFIDNKSMRSVGGTTDMGGVTSYQSYDFGSLSDKLPENARQGKVKMTMVEGRGGQQIAIPQKRMDGLGETHINIIKAENDDKLQARFKKMATDSMHDKQANFAQSGYTETTRNCPFCNGRGLIKQGKADISCPKCGGSGMIFIN